ncbi:homocysteine S-methyltransferase 1 [Gossypium australe]|uniref:Homocysteine S-methyltransferase 1 n=1 Tax=Gossypium australe TaxID=47621 RepID=A0A5B6VQV0_9ROSI|nr:homocysteine S-methyltransferase 1 [Gossypium australe]
METRDKFWDGVGVFLGIATTELWLQPQLEVMEHIWLMDRNTGPDLLAFETIPNKLEAQACVELLEEENIKIPSCICFGSVAGENAPSGESFKECFEILNKSKKVNAVGINCASPHFIESLVCKFKEGNFFKQQPDKS